MSTWRQDVDEFKKTLRPEGSRISTEAIKFGLFGTVGGGKSVTAGIFAVGITPPPSKIGWIDGEGKRSGWAIDVVADMAAAKYGGAKPSWVDRFLVVHIDPPFNPLRVVAAIESLEEAGCHTILADCLSQAWDSDGGYLDLKADVVDRLAGDDEGKRQRVASAAAARVKPATHQKLVNKVNSSKCNLVLIFQAKAKFNAKTSRPDDYVTPIQESGLTRTAIAVGKVEAKMVNGEPCGGFVTFRGELEHGVKFTHPSILALLPKNGEQFHFEHAEALLAFVNQAGGQPAGQPAKSATAPATAPALDLKTLKMRFWSATVQIHRGDKANLPKVSQFCWDENLLDSDLTLEELTAEQLADLIEKVTGRLNPKTA